MLHIFPKIILQEENKEKVCLFLETTDCAGAYWFGCNHVTGVNGTICAFGPPGFQFNKEAILLCSQIRLHLPPPTLCDGEK